MNENTINNHCPRYDGQRLAPGRCPMDDPACQHCTHNPNVPVPASYARQVRRTWAALGVRCADWEAPNGNR